MLHFASASTSASAFELHRKTVTCRRCISWIAAPRLLCSSHTAQWHCLCVLHIFHTFETTFPTVNFPTQYTSSTTHASHSPRHACMLHITNVLYRLFRTLQSAAHLQESHLASHPTPYFLYHSVPSHSIPSCQLFRLWLLHRSHLYCTKSWGQQTQGLEIDKGSWFVEKFWKFKDNTTAFARQMQLLIGRLQVSCFKGFDPFNRSGNTTQEAKPLFKPIFCLSSSWVRFLLPIIFFCLSSSCPSSQISLELTLQPLLIFMVDNTAAKVFFRQLVFSKPWNTVSSVSAWHVSLVWCPQSQVSAEMSLLFGVPSVHPSVSWVSRVHPSPNFPSFCLARPCQPDLRDWPFYTVIQSHQTGCAWHTLDFYSIRQNRWACNACEKHSFALFGFTNPSNSKRR